MTNSPLSSSEQAMVILFGILLLPSWLALGIGVIPTLALVFGITMMKRNRDFAHIRTAGLVFKILCGLVIAIALLLGSVFATYTDQTLAALMVALTAGLYIIAAHYLFLRPLSNHCDWVVANGVLATKPRAATTASANPSMGVLKAEASKAPSIADELQKWVSLKEAGHITEEEFAEARRKLLA